MKKNKKKILLSILLLIFFGFSCSHKQNKFVEKSFCDTAILNIAKEHITKHTFSPFEILLQNNGLVNINSIDSSITINLRYSTIRNFVGIDMYNEFNSCYVPKDIAIRLSNVQKALHAIDSNYSLVIFDAVRPLSIQKIMWDSCGYKGRQKKNFLSPPSQPSLHNYGAAIDASLMYNKKEVDMGTAFDFAGEAAYTYIEQDLITYKKITPKNLENRLLLRKVMKQEGFIENKYEWWHFGVCLKSQVEKKYPLIISFDSIRPIIQ